MSAVPPAGLDHAAAPAHRSTAPLALTMGDAAGIGPECIVKAWQAAALQHVVVIGDVQVMRRAARQVGGAQPIVARLDHPSHLSQAPSSLPGCPWAWLSCPWAG